MQIRNLRDRYLINLINIINIVYVSGVYYHIKLKRPYSSNYHATSETLLILFTILELYFIV